MSTDKATDWPLVESRESFREWAKPRRDEMQSYCIVMLNSMGCELDSKVFECTEDRLSEHVADWIRDLVLNVGDTFKIVS